MIVGSASTIAELRHSIERVASLPVPVLILGKNGTGKCLVARAIHGQSPWSGGPLVVLNSERLADALADTASATGLVGDVMAGARMRLGESARGGTLLLDEIADLALPLQGTLLRLLTRDGQAGDERESGASLPGARLIATTNRDPMDAIRSRVFRADLYYRLAVYTIVLPPLRARIVDIAQLVAHFLARTQEDLGLEGVSPATEPVLRRLESHSWPGNVRELENVVKQAVIQTGGLRDVSAVERLLGSEETRPSSGGLEEDVTLREIQRRHIELVLARCHGNRALAARRLGIERKSLYRIAHRFGIDLGGLRS